MIVNDLKKLIGTALVVAASAGLFIACGDDAEESCLIDADCASGEVCEGTICTPLCTDNTECAAGEVCADRVNGPGMVCQVDDTGTNNGGTNNGTNNGAGCTSNEQCEMELDDPNAICNAEEQCEIPGADPSYFQIAIFDRTTGAGCASTDNIGDPPVEVSDAGSDIMFVALERGSDVFYGEIVDQVVGTTDANVAMGFQEWPASLTDGSAPGFAMCPADGFEPGNVLALGCRDGDNGYMVVRFLDSAGGNPVELEDGDTLRVAEYGANCGGSTDDSYEPTLCDPGTDGTDPAAVTAGCLTSLGDAGSGELTFNVSIP